MENYNNYQDVRHRKVSEGSRFPVLPSRNFPWEEKNSVDIDLICAFMKLSSISKYSCHSVIIENPYTFVELTAIYTNITQNIPQACT